MVLEQAWSFLKEKRYHLMDSNKLMAMARDGDREASDEMERRLGEGVYRYPVGRTRAGVIPDFTSMEDNANQYSRMINNTNLQNPRGIENREVGVYNPFSPPTRGSSVTPRAEIKVPIGTPYGNPTGEREPFYDWQQKNTGEPMHIDTAWQILKTHGTGTLIHNAKFEHLGHTRDSMVRPYGVFSWENKPGGKRMTIPFYRSSGQSSGRGGTWYPFHGWNVGNRRNIKPGKNGWFVKPRTGLKMHGVHKKEWMDKVDAAFGENEHVGTRIGHPRLYDAYKWMNNSENHSEEDQKGYNDPFASRYCDQKTLANQKLEDAGAMLMWPKVEESPEEQ